MKGLVLAGGSGTRLRPFTYSQPKHLLPVGGKAIIDYGIEAMAAAAIREIGVVVGVETDGPLREHLTDGSRFGLHMDYVFQPEPRGLAHAVLCAEEFLAGEPFFMFLGDNLLQDPLEDMVRSFSARGGGAVIALKEVRNPSDYGVAELDAEGRVTRLLEKPSVPPTNLAVVGAYAFGPEIVDACKKVHPSLRGELEITDAIQVLIDDGRPVLPHRLAGWWKDTGKPEHLLEANQCVLDGLQRDIRGQVVDSQLAGVVFVADGARLERCRLQGPVVIGPSARVEDSCLGPYVSLGAYSRVARTGVAHSILMDEAQAYGLGELSHSILGRRASASAQSPRGTLSLLLGDDAQVRLD
ncbi:MAG: glucose-1-phosphate thymidylyltransferase [Candidatus Bipolaricaulota bacterium]